MQAPGAQCSQCHYQGQLRQAHARNMAYFGRDTAHISVWILRFPYVWLPTVLVGVAVYGHLSLSVRLLGGFVRAAGDVAASDSSRQP